MNWKSISEEFNKDFGIPIQLTAKEKIVMGVMECYWRDKLYQAMESVVADPVNIGSYDNPSEKRFTGYGYNLAIKDIESNIDKFFKED